MRSRTTKIFLVIISIIFFADDVNVDIMLAPFLSKVCHKTFHAINRDLVEFGSNRHTVRSCARTCASTTIVAVDEDDPTTLETSFPAIKAAANAPEMIVKVSATKSGFVSISYLTLHTLLI